MTGTKIICTLAAILFACCGMSGFVMAESVPQDHVVLIHGLARSKSSMASLAKRLEAEGFVAHNYDYPSTDHEPDVLVAGLAREVDRCCKAQDGNVHFVTHSLGGILVRAYLVDQRPDNLGRVVQLAPPNQGSHIVDALGENWLFASVLGPTATRLGTESSSYPKNLGPVDFELGIIAGRESINPVGSVLLPGDDDGAVTIEATWLDGAADHIVVDANHTFIMNDPRVHDLTIQFLRYGSFGAAAGSAQSEARQPTAKGK
jgi:triacylglycerol lipase